MFKTDPRLESIDQGHVDLVLNSLDPADSGEYQCKEGFGIILNEIFCAKDIADIKPSSDYNFLFY